MGTPMTWLSPEAAGWPTGSAPAGGSSRRAQRSYGDSLRSTPPQDSRSVYAQAFPCVDCPGRSASDVSRVPAGQRFPAALPVPQSLGFPPGPPVGKPVFAGDGVAGAGAAEAVGLVITEEPGGDRDSDDGVRPRPSGQAGRRVRGASGPGRRRGAGTGTGTSGGVCAGTCACYPGGTDRVALVIGDKFSWRWVSALYGPNRQRLPSLAWPGAVQPVPLPLADLTPTTRGRGQQ